ncbi:uncharacterized protein LOC118748907 [Rhagoletis pomonella]|uniref:uncharacterized protein LOC118748907 n=1 Tax=Rhagoletis pomonella TaxID=28610 RepID=UPI00177E8D28|nr:uncharacterized protein LOC118748907 [Rhagoletis pomonella]
MENNDSVDPLEKIMEELDATNADSNPYSPQTKELPHRPIVIPPEIKEEPLDSGTEPVATTTTTTDNSETAESAEIGESTEDVAKSTPNATGTTTQGREDKPSVTQTTFVTTTTDAVVGPPAAETRHANVVPTTSMSTPHVPLDAQVQIKQEKPDDEVEAPTVSAAYMTKSVASENEPADILPRIKSELIDTNDSTLVVNIPLPPPNHVTVRRNTITLGAKDTNVSAKSLKNYNMEDGELEMDETLPDNFFDDLLQNADDITAAALHAPTPTDAPQENPRIKSEPIDSSNAAEFTQSAPIPDNFFDDLLVDHVAERIEDVVNQDLEEKYSERLKELQQLESIDERSNKAHKKHKKKKKKSHKRSHADAQDDEEHIDGTRKRSKRIPRSNSRSPNSRTITLIDDSGSRSPERGPQRTRIRVKSEFMEIPDSPPRSGSLFPHAAAQPFHPSPLPLDIVNLDTDEPETSSAAAARRAMPPNVHNRMIRVKSEFATLPAPNSAPPADDDGPDISLPVQERELFQRRSSNNRNGLIIDMTTPLGFKRIKLEKDVEKSREKQASLLSPKDKILHAKQRAIDAIEALKKGNNPEKNHMVELIYTTTVRKLPNSSSYYKQQIYENRSPLHNVNNVHYKFNSHANQFNLYEWGLEAMPQVAGKVAKLLGFDAHALTEKLRTVQLPPKLQKIKQECLEQQADEQMSQPQTSFLVTVATQTNEVTVLESAAERRKNLHDIAVQAMPPRNCAATQTTALLATSTSGYDDLPLMQQINTLNENQLMALSDFAELICEPVPANGLDLYRTRQRMIDIYKCAQLPSALEPAPPQITQMVLPPSRPRDPRIEHMAGIHESPPPAPPSRHVHTTHASQQPHRIRPAMPQQHHPSMPTQNRPTMPTQSRPTMPTQNRPTMPLAHPRDSTLPKVPQKIPVISNVQSLHPGPESSKYYGRGGMRR